MNKINSSNFFGHKRENDENIRSKSLNNEMKQTKMSTKKKISQYHS